MPYHTSRKDVSLKIYPKDYVVLDIETTGLSPVQNEIIELSALKVVNGKIKEEYTQLVKPSGWVSSFITNLTGITREMLSDAPHISEALVEFTDFCSDSIIMGHNVTFDINFIDAKLNQFHNKSFNNDYIDTLKIARRMLPQLKSRKLGLIAEHFGFNTDGMHRGLKDCVVTNLCYQKFVELKQEQDSQKQNSLVF